MEPRDMVLAWIDRDVAALVLLADRACEVRPLRSVPRCALAAQRNELWAEIQDLRAEARALRHDACALRERAATQALSWPRAWGIEP